MSLSLSRHTRGAPLANLTLPPGHARGDLKTGDETGVCEVDAVILKVVRNLIRARASLGAQRPGGDGVGQVGEELAAVRADRRLRRPRQRGHDGVK